MFVAASHAGARSGPTGCPCSSASARPIGCPDRRGIESVALAHRLKAEGVDLIDCSSGGLGVEQQIPLQPGYQVPFAARIRREAGIANRRGRVGSPRRASPKRSSTKATPTPS